MQISTPSLPEGAARIGYSTPLSANGGNHPYTWSVASGSLPKGLRLNRRTGVISGRPNATDGGTYPFTVKVVDHKTKKAKGHPPTQETATKVLSITIS